MIKVVVMLTGGAKVTNTVYPEALDSVKNSIVNSITNCTALEFTGEPGEPNVILNPRHILLVEFRKQ